MLRFPLRPSALLGALAILFAMASSLAVSAVSAQVRSVSIESDNDAYDFWVPIAERPDYEYTNGLEITMALGSAPLWGRLLRAPRPCRRADSAAGRCQTTELRIGQKIFNPRVDGPTLAPGQRPFAGWLYASATGVSADERMRRAVGVEVGVTGPPSQAEGVQKAFHRAARFRDLEGWGGQLRTEPGIAIGYDERRILGELAWGGARLAEVVPYVGAVAGNVRTGAHAGVRARAGYALPHPWRASSRTGWSLYGIAGARGDLVLHDLFLNGNSFGGGPGVSPTLAVARWEAGVGARVAAFSAEYRVESRSRAYHTEPGGHTLGTFQVTLSTW